MKQLKRVISFVFAVTIATYATDAYLNTGLIHRINKYNVLGYEQEVLFDEFIENSEP